MVTPSVADDVFEPPAKQAALVADAVFDSPENTPDLIPLAVLFAPQTKLSVLDATCEFSAGCDL